MTQCKGYKQRDAYIVTQGPLENTVEDFWRMMCGCIVMLCQLVEDCQVCTPTLTHCILAYTCVCVCVCVCVCCAVGEQLLLLARGGGRGDGVWETEG